MATEDAKKENKIKLFELEVYALSKGIYDLLGDSASSVTNFIGDSVLEHMQKNMGFEVAGNDAKEIITEVGRLFVDEWGIAPSFEVIGDGDTITLKILKCANSHLHAAFDAAGITNPFMCPIMASGLAALRRAGLKYSQVMSKEGDKAVITFKLVG